MGVCPTLITATKSFRIGYSWSQPCTKILDEYHREVRPEEMLMVITCRGENWRRHEGFDDKATPGKGAYDLCPYEFS
jgi:hypothetical protein